MVRQHQTAAAVAITLALTASLAPAASADPPPLAQAEAAIAATHNGASTAVRPNADEQTMTGPAAALTSSPVACGDVCSGHGYGVVNPRPTSVRVTSGGGFNWGDAGIGAGACAVLLGIGLAGTRTVTRGRKRHPAEQRTIATG